MAAHQPPSPPLSRRSDFSTDSGNSDGSESSATAHSSTPQSPSDLEKHVTLPPEQLTLATSHRRMSRVQTLTSQRQDFRHPLSKKKTGEDVVVDFDGPDDPYRPVNWPMRKKVITTALYALTTTASTWSSSAYVNLCGPPTSICTFSLTFDQLFPCSPSNCRSIPHRPRSVCFGTFSTPCWLWPRALSVGPFK